ncbi:hypothetical protein [Corynebacterium striatum]|uniref:hypothetical protein n=1 Tax=Corynebacterium striatum TaxID=43770 RepID=UPI00234E03CF|nr:hypothetical protein [Corynebacterium striatum]MDC7106897.1 hypothetical protein [Corynebacterium striatum]
MTWEAVCGTVAISPTRRADDYLRFLDGRACDKAEPASDLVLAEDRPSRNAWEASRATRREVCLLFFATWNTSFICSTDNAQIARVRER